MATLVSKKFPLLHLYALGNQHNQMGHSLHCVLSYETFSSYFRLRKLEVVKSQAVVDQSDADFSIS